MAALSTHTKLLVLVLSCLQNRKLWQAKLTIWEDTIVLVGDPQLSASFKLVGRVLWLKCPDTYDALPQKMALAFRAILDLPQFLSVTHVLKTDDHDNAYTVEDLLRIKHDHSIKFNPYVGGRVNDKLGSRLWHFKKVPKNSQWHNKPYSGHYVPWADGGCGYILRRDALECFLMHSNLDEVKENDIYEDLMVAKVLIKCDMHPHKSNFEWIKGDK